jgi:hypothetical protein
MQTNLKAGSSRALKVKLSAQHPFVRVLGKRPSLRTAKSSTVDQFGLFVETFGPPERAERANGHLLFWNFMRNDSTEGFCLFASVSRETKLHPRTEVEVQLSAGPGVELFRGWTAVRLATVESGDETPLYVGNRAYVLQPVN